MLSRIIVKYVLILQERVFCFSYDVAVVSIINHIFYLSWSPHLGLRVLRCDCCTHM